MSKRNTEYASCVALMEWWGYAHRGYNLPENVLFHIPNQGFGAARGFHLKRMGVRAGTADYFLSVARGGFHGLWLEMKSLTGKPSKEQVAFRDIQSAQGYESVVVYGSAQARERIEQYLKL